MARRRKARKRTTKRRKARKKATKRAKSKLVGYTRTQGKYKLVFKKGKARPTVKGKGYKSKTAMLTAARKALARSK